MTADIAAFLTARLDEEAETARAVPHDGPWEPDGMAMFGWSDRSARNICVVKHTWPNEAAHIARQDPQATLDRVEATKAVVAMHRRIGVPVAPYDDDDELPACDVCWHWPEDFGKHPPRTTDYPCRTLRALATAYRRHPDYDQAWLPDGVGVDA